VRLWPEDGADLPLLSDAIDRAVESFGIMAEAAALAASLTYCQVCEQVAAQGVTDPDGDFTCKDCLEEHLKDLQEGA
jgi:hypothetical protein